MIMRPALLGFVCVLCSTARLFADGWCPIYPIYID